MIMLFSKRGAVIKLGRWRQNSLNDNDENFVDDLENHYPEALEQKNNQSMIVF